jgi:hypothetical protein
MSGGMSHANPTDATPDNTVAATKWLNLIFPLLSASRLAIF